ncbi:flavin reductase family protein [Chitinophaga alhagiae]|uniref:flavin reductase family protein n=1 Tax=Chitinophaga alhagiae TaxID=2203219 RepID=UPI000E5B6CC6|nr:flavin reductase family protein [Chitinophaga alhagiae]
MKRPYKKTDLPVWQVRKFLEPGPIVLVSSHWQGKNNIMAMGWHTVLEFSPSLLGCMITSANHSFDMVRKSGECVINIPTADMIDTIIAIGNSHGPRVNKFTRFGLTPEPAATVKAPLIRECYANIECRLADRRLVDKYNFFIFEVLKAQAATYPAYPKTVHYRGEGVFMVSGKNIAMPEKFRKGNL